MRPFHEAMRLIGIDVDEPRRDNPMKLVQLGLTLQDLGRSFAEIDTGLEILAREENIKPAVLTAACREIRVRTTGQPETFQYRRLIFSGRMDRGDFVFRAHQGGTVTAVKELELARKRHPSQYQP